MTISESNLVSDDSSFAKGLAVLGWIIDNGDSRADEIASHLDLSISSTYRLLRTLRDNRFLTHSAARFSVGPRLVGRPMGESTSVLANLAKPFLELLSSKTGETAVLTIRQGLHTVCIAQVESPNEVRFAFRIGQLLPLYGGTGSRVLMAFSPEHVIQEVLADELTPYTPNTLARTELVESLKRIRTNRFACSRGELIQGAVAIAVPVLRGSAVVCALTVAGPTDRCTFAWQQNARAELESVARSLSVLVEPAP